MIIRPFQPYLGVMARVLQYTTYIEIHKNYAGRAAICVYC